jgi:hypothetical protein
MRDRILVFLVEEDDSGRPTHYHFDKEGMHYREAHIPGTEMQPAFILPEWIANGLLMELEKLFGSDDSMMRRLYRRADALMATLIEQEKK